MLKPSDLTKAELLQVMEILSGSAEYELERALSQIERKRNDTHYEKSRRLIDEEKSITKLISRSCVLIWAKLLRIFHPAFLNGRRKSGTRPVPQGENGIS